MLGLYIGGSANEVGRPTAENAKGLSPCTLWYAYTQKLKTLESSFGEAMEQAYLIPSALDTQRQVPFNLETQRPFCCRASGQEHIWDPEKLLLTNYRPIYTRHYKKPMLISTPPEDLPMFQAVQRHVRQKVQNAGIFAETNPTSNLSIGDISSLRDYPITRLNTPPLPEPNPTSILLSINSDNLLVFNTNAENELDLVYHTLTYREHGREQVLNWIDKVRQYGMDSGFIRGAKGSVIGCCGQ